MWIENYQKFHEDLNPLADILEDNVSDVLINTKVLTFMTVLFTILGFLAYFILYFDSKHINVSCIRFYSLKSVFPYGVN